MWALWTLGWVYDKKTYHYKLKNIIFLNICFVSLFICVFFSFLSLNHFLFTPSSPIVRKYGSISYKDEYTYQYTCICMFTCLSDTNTCKLAATHTVVILHYRSIKVGYDFTRPIGDRWTIALIVGSCWFALPSLCLSEWHLFFQILVCLFPCHSLLPLYCFCVLFTRII